MMDPDSKRRTTQVKRGRSQSRKNSVSALPTDKKRRFWRPSKTSGLVILLLIVALGTSGYFYKKYHDTQNKLNNPTAVAQNETAMLVTKIGKLAYLPSNETPTLATVTDISKLKGQAFFADAQNGDKILIYTQAKQAYLYRPSTNKIINIAPLNLGNTNSSSQQGTGH